MSNDKLTVFYNPKQTVRDNERSFSPSAGKPEHVVKQFSKNPRVKVVSEWEPLTQSELSIAHDPQFVQDVLSLKKENGFGNKLRSVADSLPYTAGSFYNAAVHAYIHDTAAMSPTSGFHHSSYGNCHGFCTFNGLVISAFLLYKRLHVEKIGIIDCDAHYGDGTENILNKFKNARDVVEHFTFGSLRGKPVDPAKPYILQNPDFNEWLDGFDHDLSKRFKDCSVLFYQAGADPHIDDPLGGYLTTEQMKRRDEIVFKFAKKYGKPIVWNLAGGYQTPLQKVLDLHNNTLDACLAHYFDAP
jgi:acetoin utilization deacetylase AcuC-like enzyme